MVGEAERETSETGAECGEGRREEAFVDVKMRHVSEPEATARSDGLSAHAGDEGSWVSGAPT